MSACAPTTEAGPGIVSTSLCGDSYVLAGGADVAALSWQSGGPLGSGWGGLKASADPERLVALQPEVLVLGPGESVRDGVLPNTEIIRLDWVEDWEGVKTNSSLVAATAGTQHMAEGAPSLDPGLRRDKREHVSILYLSRAGGTAGPGTYVDAAIRMAGGRNIVTTPGWSTPDPEWILAQDPDVVLTSFFAAYESVNAPVARPGAVRSFVSARRRIDVPGRLWPCAGPGLIGAAELISAGLDEL